MTRLSVPSAALLLLLLVLAACSPEAAEDALAPEVSEMDEGVVVEHAPGPVRADGEPAAEADPPDAAEDAPEREGTDPAGDLLPPQVRPAGRDGEHVIKEGTVTLDVDEGEFNATYERVVEAARREGGSIAASHSGTDDQGRTSGAITVRVPVENFESLLVAIARISEPVAQNIRSEDVSGQVVDLEARLRHLRAQEDFYLELLEDAADIQDAIRIQQQVEDIQQRIEQLQGRLDFLQDRADYSTLTVEIAESGADTVLVAGRDDDPSLALYWNYARTGFVTLIGWMLVVAVTLAPILLPLAAALFAWRLAARRRPAAPATVAADTD